jgi:predicted Zn-dependent protease with MMP-like domain
MDKDVFKRLVEQAINNLPEEFLSKLDNVDVVVQDYPNHSQLTKARLKGGYTLLGLYQGVPQTKRGVHYGLVLPDKITLFQKPIEARCRSDFEIMNEISRVLKHEIAHHFGISDERLLQIEREKKLNNKKKHI